MNTSNTMDSGIDGKATTAPTDRMAQDNRDENQVIAELKDVIESNRAGFFTDFGPYNLSRRQ